MPERTSGQSISRHRVRLVTVMSRPSCFSSLSPAPHPEPTAGDRHEGRTSAPLEARYRVPCGGDRRADLFLDGTSTPPRRRRHACGGQDGAFLVHAAGPSAALTAIRPPAIAARITASFAWREQA